jgi:hypothetical protein
MLDPKLVCFYRNEDNVIQKIEFNFYNDHPSFVHDFKVKYNDDSISDDDFIIFSYLNNKIKYLLCLNSNKYDDFRIYFKNTFPYQNTNGGVIPINDLDKPDFSCKNNTEKLLSLLFINSRLEDMLTIQEYDDNEANFYYFSNGFNGAISLKQIDNISSIIDNNLRNTIQLYIVKAFNWANEIYYDSKNDDITGKIEYTFFSSTILGINSSNMNHYTSNYQINNKTELLQSTNNNIEKQIITTDRVIRNSLTSEIYKTINPKRFDFPNISIFPPNYIVPRNNEIIKELYLPKPYITKEEILENIQNIIEDTIIGETYEYQKDDFSILIYPTDSNLLTNKTHIDFVECESILKTHYNLSNQSIITFFQMEISNKNEHSLINQVEYQVYDEQKNLLDLAKCNNSNINIFYGIKKDSNLDISIVNSFKDSGVNVFNITDEFFNDVCYPYSENGNDVILEDRIKDIYQNFTLCEEGCSFNDIDIFNMLISCQCIIKQNITTIIKEIKEEAVEKITSLNFEIIRCYNLVFSFKGKMGNIGFWILSIFFVIYILFFIILK